MADTIRTRAALQSLLADNVNGDISAQDIRDFLVSTYNWVNATIGGNISYTEGNVGIGTTAPSQELDLIGDLELEMTTSNDTGVIYKGANRFIHNFSHPTGDTAVPNGGNTFVGINSGNFTTGSTATSTTHASHNTAIGYQTLRVNTTGYQNTDAGGNSMHSNTTGYRNTASGYSSLYSNTEGIGNVAIGYNAGDHITTGDYNIMIGYDIDAPSATGDNQLNIGDTIYGDLSTGNVGIGTASPEAKLDVNGDSVRIRTAQTPASNGAGNQGEIAWDADFLYVCTATNVWKRCALTGGY